MPCTERAKSKAELWAELSSEEKLREDDLHIIMHQLLKEMYPGKMMDAHAKMDEMNDKEYEAFFRKALERLRARMKRLKAAADYARSQGRNDQAAQADAEAAVIQQAIEVAQ